jgi:hypothetical protein
MEKLRLTHTFKTPEVDFDSEKGYLKLSGRIFPENPKEFFAPLLDWIKNYSNHPASLTTLVLNLTYFNSSSNEYIFRCCKQMEAMSDLGNEAQIVWEYETDDDDMRHMGEDYKELLKIKFDIKAVS